MPYSDKEAYKEYQRQWRAKNRDRVKGYDAKWKHTPEYLAKQAARARRNRLAARQQLLDKLGRVCAMCGIADIRVLQLHHVNGGGNDHRRALFGSQSKSRIASSTFYYRALLALPEGEVQVLCSNCHILAEWELARERNSNDLQ